MLLNVVKNCCKKFLKNWKKLTQDTVSFPIFVIIYDREINDYFCLFYYELPKRFHEPFFFNFNSN